MEDNVQKLANAGQPEDSQIIHAAPGEMVVPPVISEQTQQMINQDLQSVGLNPAEYMVGQGSINNLSSFINGDSYKDILSYASFILPGFKL